MVDPNSNDNDVAPGGGCVHGPDAHGQAAMLLVESLIHGLISRSVISVDNALEIVGMAAEVKAEIAAELSDSSATMDKSLTMLRVIHTSLKIDLLGEEVSRFPMEP